jgi:uncharacterized protein (TIGR02145 family)
MANTNLDCQDGIVVTKCGTGWYNATTQFCGSNIVYYKCNGQNYTPATQYCKNSTTPTQYGSVTYDEQTYKTVVIGEQTWMAENLNYSSSSIFSIPGTYGRLYDWATAMALPHHLSCNSSSCSSHVSAKHQGICPDGWHIPSNADWDKLIRYVDGNTGTYNPSNLYYSSTAYKFLKATSGWSNDSGNGTDNYGFSAFPGGEYYGSGFSMVGTAGVWWSSDEKTNSIAYQFFIYNDRTFLRDYEATAKSYFFSVRCIKDN